MTELQEARLLSRAITSRWEIPADVRSAVVQTLMEIACTGVEDSARIAACRALIAAEGQNQKDEHAKIDEFRNRVLTIAQRCGIDVNLLGTSQAAVRGPAAGAPVNAFSADERTG